MSESSLMPTRRDQIVEAATGIFWRYGYARTTMSDIAQASGLTRPTLYLSFPDKEQIFAAVVEKMVAEKLAEIRGQLPRHGSFEDQLRYACEAWVCEGYELVQAHPDAKDMFDLGFKSVSAGYEAFTELLAALIAAPLRARFPELGAAETARSIVAALKGFKDMAGSAGELRRLIAVHTRLVAGALRA